MKRAAGKAALDQAVSKIGFHREDRFSPQIRNAFCSSGWSARIRTAPITSTTSVPVARDNSLPTCVSRFARS